MIGATRSARLSGSLWLLCVKSGIVIIFIFIIFVTEGFGHSINTAWSAFVGRVILLIIDNRNSIAKEQKTWSALSRLLSFFFLACLSSSSALS